jgi:16S rRNA (uracil1498-N3)-methyltransferase
LPPGPAQHLARVLRLAVGDPLILFNGRAGEHAARVEAVRRAAVTVRVGMPEPIERESPLATTLLQGIARGDKMDQIVQKATELGVARVIPVLTARGNVRLGTDAAHRKQQHWQGVAVAACEQCGRNRVPEVARPALLAAALADTDAALRLLMAPEDGAATLPALLAAATTGAGPLRTIALLVGPEGGLDREEMGAARLAGFQPCRLGPRVLRTETAALAMLAALQFAAGDLR